MQQTKRVNVATKAWQAEASQFRLLHDTVQHVIV